MKVFTYKDYIKSIHKVRLNSVMKFAEEYAVYGNSKKEQTKEENINVILKNTEEMAKFINYFLEPRRKIYSNELLLYSSKFLSKRHKNVGNELIYKVKKSNTYFLVKTTPKVDFKISSKLMSYCVDIIYEANKDIYPSVVPIVIYTGNEKWIVPSESMKKQEDEFSYKNSNIEMKYNLIQLKNISNQKLLKINSEFSNYIILERLKESK